mmetsp:Transcript_18392/g.63373  ORF Transcript_18392/g.63373 Transcript_18392/m.63373 type:complete len:200 (-) Transcript_18392:20-619(-)
MGRGQRRPRQHARNARLRQHRARKALGDLLHGGSHHRARTGRRIVERPQGNGHCAARDFLDPRRAHDRRRRVAHEIALQLGAVRRRRDFARSQQVLAALAEGLGAAPDAAGRRRRPADWRRLRRLVALFRGRHAVGLRRRQEANERRRRSRAAARVPAAAPRRRRFDQGAGVALRRLRLSRRGRRRPARARGPLRPRRF